MEKNQLYYHLLVLIRSKTLRIMKFLTIFLFIFTFYSFVDNSYSQNAKVKIDLKEASLSDMISSIEKQSEFVFIFKDELLPELQKIKGNIRFNNKTVQQVLSKALVGTKLVYEVNDRQIVLKEKITPPLVFKVKSEINIIQSQIKGAITDENNMPLPGATILIKGTQKGTSTDFDGNYSIVAADNDILVLSFVGYATQEIAVKGEQVINASLKPDNSLDEVVLVSFGKQKKSSIVSSITTVKPSELKIPSSNLTTALAGRVSGLIAYQRSGEPGQDNAEFFIRGITSFGAGGNSPLILIDGVELSVEDLARLQPDDIASFSILKDASATALYGARGANGAVFVTTKEGVEGPLQISLRYETSLSTSTRDIELADPITYMELFNEAVRTRDALDPIPFSEEKINKTRAGINPLLYPTVDWQDKLFGKFAINQRANFSLRGGGKKVRFYVSSAFSQDKGILTVPKINNFNSNIDLKKVQIRSNTNINLSPKSKLKLAFNVAFDDYNGPIQGGSQIYTRSLRTSPVWFQPFYEKDEATRYTKHILFGNRLGPAGNGFYFNPYADLAKGFKETTGSSLISQLEYDLDLSDVTKGLSAKATVSATRRSSYNAIRSYNPFYYQPFENSETGEISLTSLNANDNSNLIGGDVGREDLSFTPGATVVSSASYLETRLTYARQFKEKHDIGGLLVFTRNHRVSSSQSESSLEGSLPFRNEGISGRFTYGYDNKYFTELNFGYNGSERFAKKNRWGFFPSAAIGWIASNEKLFDNIDFVDNLKFKASLGLVGNDQIGSQQDRFYYLSRVTLNDGSRGFISGADFSNVTSGVSIQRFANEDITWETGEKFNFGLELGLFNALKLEVDYFTETRRNIFTDRIVPSSLGLQAAVRANVGEAKNRGVDGSLEFTKNISKDFWFQARGSFTFSRSEIVKVEEPDYSATPWRSAVGHSISQQFGFVAERLFIDQEEVNNSPTQFGNYTGGDIKYKDIDGNGVINDLDQVAIGNPTSPEIVYGMGISTGYKNFDFSIFFQGSANSSFWVDTSRTAPFESFQDGSQGGVAGIVNNQLLKVWADDHWSEENRDLYAKWPRLSANNNTIVNNQVRSTWFLQDGTFLRLKSIELGYNLPKDILKKLNVSRFRFYLSGTNLLTFSKFKLWDPELAGNGLGYPSQRVFNLGINISL